MIIRAWLLPGDPGNCARMVPTFFKYLLIICVLAGVSGCATQSAREDDPFLVLEAMDVKFLHEAPPNAKFIARIPYSSGAYDNWQKECLHTLRLKAAKLGGNVVVPGTELDWGTHRIYRDQMVVMQTPVINVPEPRYAGEMRKAPVSNMQIIQVKLHFWSNVYSVPE